MKKEKAWLEEIAEFLEYLGKNNGNLEKRKEKNLIEKFGREKSERIISLCMDEGYTRREVVYEEKERCYRIKITDNGIKFLEGLRRESVKLKQSKTLEIANIVLAIATIGLLIVTIIYAHTTNKSFETENRPYIYVEEVYATKIEGNISQYQAKITNFGNFPGRMEEIKVKSEECGGDFSMKDFPKTTLIKPNEEIFVTIDAEWKGAKQATIELIIDYMGVGNLEKEKYEYYTKIIIDKEKNHITIEEGKI